MWIESNFYQKIVELKDKLNVIQFICICDYSFDLITNGIITDKQIALNVTGFQNKAGIKKSIKKQKTPAGQQVPF